MKKILTFPSESGDIQKFQWGEVIWIHEPKNLNIERMSVGLVKIFPKVKHLKHLHFGEEQILYTLQGRGIHRINGKEESINEGMVLHCPPYSEHEVINIEDIDLIFMIIYTPVKLIDFQPNLSMVSRDHILDYLDIELLNNIQEHMSNFLQLSVKITDAQKQNITNFTNLNSFCTLCPYLGNCKEEATSVIKGAFRRIEEVCRCRNDIIVFQMPILVNNNIIGYIKCGHLLINRVDNIEEKISLIAENTNINYNDLLKAYNDLPLVPKSRLYALEESLIVASKYIAEIIEKSIIQNELKEKNNQILEKIQKNIELQNTLDEANSKLLKYDYSSKFNIVNYEHNKMNSLTAIQYPFEKEIELENCLKLCDEKGCIEIVNEIIEDYEKSNIHISLSKEVFDELISITSRIVYKEINDMEILIELRKKYKLLIHNCSNYKQLKKQIIDYFNECIQILSQVLHRCYKDIISQVNIYIKENYYQDLTLKSIAEKFYISPNYLSKIFNEQNKMSLTDYINKIRIDKAKEYLCRTNMKISIISKKVGCSNISYFSYIFKKVVNFTPKEYRLKYREGL